MRPELLNLDEIDQWMNYKTDKRSHSSVIQMKLEDKAIEAYQWAFEQTGSEFEAKKAYFKILYNDSKVNDGSKRSS